MEVKGIFVTKIDKANAKLCFEEITKKYGNKTTLMVGNPTQKSAIMKAYCYYLTVMIDRVFHSEMYGASRCKRRIKELSIKPIDDKTIQSSISELFEIIIDLTRIVNDSIPINELPSCKDLIGMNVEDTISASKDLVKSNIVKVAVGSLLTVVDAGNIIDICEVLNYYKNQKKELEFELKQEQRGATEIEQFLIDKYEAEIGYCNLAGLKVGLSGFNEVMELKENAQKAIDKFVSRKINKSIAIKQ